MSDILFNCIDWFCQIIKNVCDSFYSLMNYTIDLSIIGLPSNTSLVLVLIGSGLLILIVAKIIQWVTPIV